MLQNTNQGKADVFRGNNERSSDSFISLGIKKQKTKHDWLFLMINCRT